MKNNIQSSIIELAGEDVERVDGLPTAFRIFKQGENAISKLGIDTALILEASDIASIVGYHTKKGVKIPIDSEHFMRYIAKKNGIEESDLAVISIHAGTNRVRQFSRKVWRFVGRFRKQLHACGEESRFSGRLEQVLETAPRMWRRVFESRFLSFCGGNSSTHVEKRASSASP